MAYNFRDGITASDSKTYYWDFDTNDFVTTTEVHVPVNQVPADVIVNYINKISSCKSAADQLVKPLRR